MSLWAACIACSFRELVEDQPDLAALRRAGEIAREHSLTEHFHLVAPGELAS